MLQCFFAKNQTNLLSVTENHNGNSFEITTVFPEINLVLCRLSNKTLDNTGNYVENGSSEKT